MFDSEKDIPHQCPVCGAGYKYRSTYQISQVEKGVSTQPRDGMMCAKLYPDKGQLVFFKH